MPEIQKTFTRNFLVLFTGNSIGQLIPFLLAPIIARIFTPAELGAQENFLAIVSMVAIIAAGRYDLAIVLPKEKNEAVLLFRIGLIITIVVSALVLLTSLFPRWLTDLYNSQEITSLALFFAPAVLLLSILSLLNYWVTREGKYAYITAARITQSTVQNLGYIILGYAGWGIKGLIVAWLLGLFVPILLLLFPSINSIHSVKVSNTQLGAIANKYRDFPMVNSIHAFTDIFATQFLLYWIITKNFNLIELGLFAITSKYLRAPLNLIGSAVSQLYYKDSSEASDNPRHQMDIFKRSVKLTFLLVLPIILIITIWGPWIFELYLGKDWVRSGEIARIVAPALFFNILASVVSATPIIFNRQKCAYLYNLIGYFFSIGALYLGTILQQSFETSILLYAIASTVYYISMLIWYKNLINRHLS